jgi:threonine dehydratase
MNKKIFAKSAQEQEKIINRLNAASNRMQSVIKETPAIYSYFFSEEYEASIYLKAENLQRTGAFKIRGAYNKIALLSEEDRKRGLIASSAGNHAQGVALAGKTCGAKATIVMPANTPLIKVEATRHYGAEVVLHGECYDDAYREAMRLQATYGYTFIHPFDDEEVIDGQGTIGLEIIKQVEGIDMVIVPIGGGGLISGIAMAIKTLRPEIKVIGVEPEGAQTLRQSILKNQIVELTKVNTIAEGVAVKRGGQLPFQLIKEYVDDIITVSDVDIMEAFLLLTEKEKIIAENAGVLSIAALKKLDVKGKTIVPIISGGNIDVVTISELISRGLVVRGRVFCFTVELSDTPGELQEIATILADLGANIIKLDQNQFKTIDRFKQVLLEITCETNGKKHVEQIKKALKDKAYSVKVVY